MAVFQGETHETLGLCSEAMLCEKRFFSLLCAGFFFPKDAELISHQLNVQTMNSAVATLFPPLPLCLPPLKLLLNITGTSDLVLSLLAPHLLFLSVLAVEEVTHMGDTETEVLEVGNRV